MLAQGLAWAAPAVVLAQTTPAYAASLPSGPVTYTHDMYQAQYQDCQACGPGQPAYTWQVGWEGGDYACSGGGAGGSFVRIDGVSAGDVISNVALYFPYSCAHAASGQPITWVRGAEGPNGVGGWTDPGVTTDLDGYYNPQCNYTIQGDHLGSDHFIYKIASTRTWTLGLDAFQCPGRTEWVLPDWVVWLPEALVCGGGHQDVPSSSISDPVLTLAVNGVQLPLKAIGCQSQNQACS